MSQQPKKSSSKIPQSKTPLLETMQLKTPRPIFIIEDDPDFAEIYQKHLARNFPEIPLQIFYNAIEANAVFSELSEEELPSLIILDVLLTGPDGFTLLNELLSYPETSQIPVLLISSLNLGQMSLQAYNVRAILNKETFTPADFVNQVQDILKSTNHSSARNDDLAMRDLEGNHA
mgnify:FL=1|jgi:phosphate regulon response regulator phoB